MYKQTLHLVPTPEKGRIIAAMSEANSTVFVLFIKVIEFLILE